MVRSQYSLLPVSRFVGSPLEVAAVARLSAPLHAVQIRLQSTKLSRLVMVALRDCRLSGGKAAHGPYEAGFWLKIGQQGQKPRQHAPVVSQDDIPAWVACRPRR